MANIVIMPKQGLQMTEGTITRWIVQEGGQVELDMPLFEMETDKLTIEICASVSGTLLKILKTEGQTVPITHPIAIIGDVGEDISSLLSAQPQQKAQESKVETASQNTATPSSVKAQAAKTQDGRTFATPRARMLASQKNLALSSLMGSGPEGEILARDVLDVKISPLAKKLAADKGVVISNLHGSGVGGKIMKEDIEAQSVEQTVLPFTGMRKVIADRMSQSLHTMAQANHRMKVDMTQAMALRQQYAEKGQKISYTDIFVQVVSKALLEHPLLNSTLTDRGIVLQPYVHMGLAVALDNGLRVPVIKNTHTLSLAEISAASLSVIDKTKKGTLSPDDYQHGTFTLTNLGMFDIDEFTAIINPPQSAILAIGKIEKTLVVIDDAIVIRPILVLSLTYDHRIIDGAPAAMFLQTVKKYLQSPTTLKD